MDKLKRGSVTVETALVLPLLIIFFMQLYTAFEMLALYCRVEVALEETAEEAATFLYIRKDSRIAKEQSFLLTETFIREEVSRKIGTKNLSGSVLQGKAMGLSLFRSDIATDGKNVDLVVTYRVKPWYAIGNVGTIQLMNHCKVTAWTGYQKDGSLDEEKKEKTVYITESGSVYHLYRDCTFLDAKVETVLTKDVGKERNSDRKIYYPCELCAQGKEMDTFCYITPYGTRYHKDEGCEALHKSVRAVSLSEVGGRRVCSKCSQRSQNE